MFSKLKQFRDLRSQAKTIQDVLAQEVITEEKNGVTIKMNGNMEVLNITLAGGMDKAAQENALKNCFNEAVKKAQRLMAKKLQDMGGIPGLTQ
ncbi:MAG: YbaB/EbfC family nucleoid-associated protein [Candidatus Falkowbacteria bacterium]|nr:MAG: YbaB/EbfC family nucleoid-associated protein [Candidatus Falkowbacteria bacterium]